MDRVSSTNAFLLGKPEGERVGCVVWAGDQTAGKGMGSNVWESAPGLNLTFSMGLDLSFLKAADQFLLSQAVPLGVMDGLLWRTHRSAPTGMTVKWPNDIYYGNRKLGGILINSTIHGMDMGVSVIGIGLNVNQMQFRDWPVPPVSLKMIMGEEMALEPLLNRLVEAVERKVQLLRLPDGVTLVKNEYLDRLYRYRVWADYEVDGVKVKRFITGIDAFGHLETLDESGHQYVYDLKEIRFIP